MIVPGDQEGSCNLVRLVGMLKKRHRDPFGTSEVQI